MTVAEADPDLALRAAQRVADLHGQAVEDLLRIVARRLARGIDEPGWAERKLIEQLALRDEAAKVVAALRDATPDVIDQAIIQGYRAGAGAATGGGAGPTIATNVPALQALVDDTVRRVVAMQDGILRATMDAYRSIVADTAGQVLTGSQTRLQAAQAALNRYTDRGIGGFVDTAGRRWQIETYAEMSTRTAVGRAQVSGSLDRITADGSDLVIVSDAPQECKVCRKWEGKVLSVRGDTEKGTRVGGFTVAGTVAEAQAAGLHHPNCRHRLGKFVPGSPSG